MLFPRCSSTTGIPTGGCPGLALSTICPVSETRSELTSLSTSRSTKTDPIRNSNCLDTIIDVLIPSFPICARLSKSNSKTGVAVIASESSGASAKFLGPNKCDLRRRRARRWCRFPSDLKWLGVRCSFFPGVAATESKNRDVHQVRLTTPIESVREHTPRLFIRSCSQSKKYRQQQKNCSIARKGIMCPHEH